MSASFLPFVSFDIFLNRENGELSRNKTKQNKNNQFDRQHVYQLNHDRDK